uniref:Uncharacterized protein n=1 Tax=Amphimedon queenslandica TaxID=400682 RepID=A0A1X7VSZ6_AMPQE
MLLCDTIVLYSCKLKFRLCIYPFSSQAYSEASVKTTNHRVGVIIIEIILRSN